MHIRISVLLLLLLVVVSSSAAAQQSASRKIVDALTHDTCVIVEDSQAKVCHYDFLSKGLSIEAISFQPTGKGPFPGILLIPGYQRTAVDLIPLGMALSRAGLAAVAVTQPGFGKSQGKPDYVGPDTLRVLTEAWQRLKHEAYVDPHRLGIYGFSRGGMACSLLAVKLAGVRAAVFGAGIYDFKKAHDEAKIEGIRQNMEAETGFTDAAIRERSSILRMDQLKCPVLILHGEKDENVPVTQAYMLRDRLTALKKDFEIKLFPDRPHGIGPEVIPLTVDFFTRRLLP